MNLNEYEHFVCIVAGENPEIMMNDFLDSSNPEKRVVYKYEEAEKIQEQFKKMYQELINNKNTNPKDKSFFQQNYDYICNITSEDFFEELTQNYRIDEETGDAYIINNPDGHFSSFAIGKSFSLPFILYDGTETYQARKSDIDWSKIHLNGQDTYRVAWETVMENRAPKNEWETKIFENMQNRVGYLNKFQDKETYVASCTAFWGYAFFSKETGWVELSDGDNQFEWMINYLSRFIFPLDGNTLLTIFECKK